MLGWIKVLQKKFFKMNKIVQILIILILGYLITKLLKLFSFSYFSGTYLENFGNPTSCTYYYWDKCKHCIEFMPTWDQFVQNYNGNIVLKKVEKADAGADLEKYKIQGFPTVVLFDKDGNTKTFEGSRTQEGLKQFLS